MANLIELGAWDPFNVTEDADLGLRAYSKGYKVAIINSTTYEEANNDFLTGSANARAG
jgi:cellulose synthase/poly-beta-1,6-N-acetylglucosamine synthase-like glycosyltransferase